MATKSRSDNALIRTDLEPRPVMFVYGPERALVDSLVAHIRKSVLAGGMADFNHDRLSAKDASVEQVLACARTLPVMAPQRLVEVADGDAFNADALDKLAAYAAMPYKESVLLVVLKEADRRTKAIRSLQELQCLYKYEHLNESQLASYAQMRARQMGLTLDEEAASVLVSAVGTELQLLERALEKLLLVANDQTVRVADIEEHISQTRVDSVFKLTDAIARNDTGAALSVLGQMLDAREPPLRILATLAWQQRQILRARDLLDRGDAPSNVLRELRVFRNGDRFIKQVRSLPSQRVANGLLVIAKTDRILKSSRASQRAVMERAVMELAAPI